MIGGANVQTSFRRFFMFVVLTITAPQLSFPDTSAAATLTTTNITAAQVPEQEHCGRVFSVQRRSLRYQQKVWRLECTLQRCYKGGVWSWIRWMAKITARGWCLE
eukprot:gene10348-biopygen15323